MFFLLSKILSFLLVPFNWCLLLLVLGFLLKKQRLRKIIHLSTLAIFLFFSNTFIFQQCVSGWEHPAEALEKHKNTQGNLVILGGLSSYDDETGRIHFKEATDRLLQGLLLYHDRPERKIIISGGSAEIYFDERPEADYLHEFLIKTGIPSQNILFEVNSRNTYENALNTAALMDSMNMDKSIILVSSGFHLPRAIACFKKQGFTVKPLAAHTLSNHQPLKPADYFLPSLNTLQCWPLLTKEWVGILVYKLKGYI
ncbi:MULTISPECIES: YdcF family protein [unclassified Carboxylicivirga]|uniref:YdcF family protein n=1 Tax=Carboxylicivirga TaxID=1628153 RepID=UPI003D3466CA